MADVWLQTKTEASTQLSHVFHWLSPWWQSRVHSVGNGLSWRKNWPFGATRPSSETLGRRGEAGHFPKVSPQLCETSAPKPSSSTTRSRFSSANAAFTVSAEKWTAPQFAYGCPLSLFSNGLLLVEVTTDESISGRRKRWGGRLGGGNGPAQTAYQFSYITGARSLARSLCRHFLPPVFPRNSSLPSLISPDCVCSKRPVEGDQLRWQNVG